MLDQLKQIKYKTLNDTEDKKFSKVYVLPLTQYNRVQE